MAGLPQHGSSLRGLPDMPADVAPWAFSTSPRPPPGSPASMAAVPVGLPASVLRPPYRFLVPVKRIESQTDMDIFLQSDALRSYLGFVVLLSEAVKGHKLSDECHTSKLTSAICDLLLEISSWIDDIPPVTTAVRYGNPSFREWQARLEEKGPGIVGALLPQDLKPALEEIYPYFADSFGNTIRIDYGTGHEVNFTAWLLCLARLGLLVPEDYQAVVTRVFVKYLDLMRKLQTTYWLEPAGSHGVWGLDDYQFLPFVFGSSQLVGHKYMKPKSIHNEDVMDQYSSEYLYLGCVQFVKKMKKGVLAEHSPMINDISGVPTWQKVNSGMLKMYRAECLEKVPIMQHFLFGSIINWPG